MKHKTIIQSIGILKDKLVKETKPVIEFYSEYIENSGMTYFDFLRNLHFFEIITGDMQTGIDLYICEK